MDDDLYEDDMDDLEEKGRDTDTVVGHLTVGEIIIPAQIASQPEVQKILMAIFEGNNVSMDEFTVGHPSNKINPETGYPEFFLKKAWKAVTGAVKSVVGGVAKAIGLAPKVQDNSQAAKEAAKKAEEAALRARGGQVDTSIMSAQEKDQLRRRRGRAANILAAEEEPISVGARRLLGH